MFQLSGFVCKIMGQNNLAVGDIAATDGDI